MVEQAALAINGLNIVGKIQSAEQPKIKSIMNPLSKLFSREAFTSIGLMVLILLVAVQFLRPELKERPVTRDITLPADVKAIFKKSCYDCHSNETQLGWGDQIVPAYWLVARHIRQGRAHLNFSEWDKLTPAERKQKLWEAVNHTALGAMPRADYVFMHPAAKVSDKELTILKNYLASLVVHEPPDTSKINDEAIQYQQWLHTKAQSILPVSPNRITYDPNYKN
ncbi:hypothetical protein DIU36_24155 [Mucilaginibacter rubeus]|nr:hypothetical protein DIU36_24155 [Mucilaginibacter rubeus]